MATKKRKTSATNAPAPTGGRKRRSDFKGLKAVLFRLEEAQDKALTVEALRRASEAGTARPDKSAVLREILAAWMARRR